MDGFLSNFTANFLATILGISIGVPVALWLERRRLRKEEKSKEDESKERTKKILELLRCELDIDKRSIDHIHKDVANYYEPLKAELWTAFADGGELQWIDEPGVLDMLSFAYSEVSQVRFLYEKYFEAFFFSGSLGNLNLRDVLFKQLEKASTRAKKQIDTTLDSLDAKLKHL